jgi:NTP pyrophosphatase (non-canonical NTP hydrolase)
MADEMTVVLESDAGDMPGVTIARALNIASAYIGAWAKGKGFREADELADKLDEISDDLDGIRNLSQSEADLLRRASEVMRTLEAGNKHMLIVTEVGEAQEELRDTGADNICESYGEELADIIVRVLDRAQAAGIENIGELFMAKLAKNDARPHKHGRKF